MKTNILAAAIVAGLPTISLAQGFGHLGSEFTLGYSVLDGISSGETNEGFLVAIKTDWALGASFGLQLNGGTRDVEAASIQTLGLHGWYQVNPTIRLGAFAQLTNVVIESAPDGITGQLFGVEALIEPADNAEIQIYAATGQNDLNFLSVSGDMTSYGVSARYDFTPSFSGRIFFDQGNQNIMGTPIDSQVMGFGFDWHTKGFGTTPVTIAFDYAHTQSIAAPVDRFSVTAKIGIGGKDEKKRRLFDDRHSPAFTLIF